MMRYLETRPVLMGGLMGLMMLMMAHQMLTGSNGGGGGVLLIFVLAHVAIGLVVLTGAVIAARLSPRLRSQVARIHRPSATHGVSMLAGMIGATGLAHLSIHAGIF